MFSWLEYFINWLKSLFWSYKLEITLIGLQQAGKTTFCNVLSTGHFDEDLIPTIGFNMRKIKKGAVTINVWDIGGQARFRSMWEKYCIGVKCIVYMVDISTEAEGLLAEARDNLHMLMDAPDLEGTPLLVLGNKCDKPHSIKKEDLWKEMKLSEFSDRQVDCFTISCKDQTNLDLTLDYLVKMAKKVE